MEVSILGGFSVFLKWDIWESGIRILTFSLTILKFVFSVQYIDFK
ncbi:hypothetical protein [Xenorhabdus cabanillasii]|nr:hypothetical protein [Xenorhabdus sp. Flor]